MYGEGSQLEEAQLRFDTVKSKFREIFGHAPQVFARSPGSLSFSLYLYVSKISVWFPLLFFLSNRTFSCVHVCLHGYALVVGRLIVTRVMENRREIDFLCFN